MTRIKWFRGTAVGSIAAVLALSSTQLLAQAAPATTEPVTVASPPVSPDISPRVTTPSEPVANGASEPLAVEPTIATPKARKSTTIRHVAIKTSPAKAAPKVARASVAAPAVKPAEIAAASPAPLVATPTAPSPAVKPAPASAPALATAPTTHEAPAASNNLPIIAGAAGVGLVGLIAFGLAMRRRKLGRDEELAAAEQYEPALAQSAQADPVFAEAVRAPVPIKPMSAMPVAAEPETVATGELPTTTSPCADTAPGSHVEAACGGPTPDNPSLSIKKRLKRAHFFDEREFLAAAGEVPPMAPNAGLPDAVTVPESAVDKPE